MNTSKGKGKNHLGRISTMYIENTEMWNTCPRNKDPTK